MNNSVNRQKAKRRCRSAGNALKASARLCHAPTANENAKSAKKLPVSSCHSAREARRKGVKTPAPAARAAGNNVAGTTNLGGRTEGGTAPRRDGAGVRMSGCRTPFAAAALRAGCVGAPVAGVSAVAASTASMAVRAASRAPLPSTRPNRTRSMAFILRPRRMATWRQPCRYRLHPKPVSELNF